VTAKFVVPAGSATAAAGADPLPSTPNDTGAAESWVFQS